jgi:hypothetical protein
LPLSLAAENVSRRRPIEPHRAFAAEADHAAPDQNIGACLFEKGAHFRLGCFRARLLGIYSAVDWFDRDAVELLLVAKFVEQEMFMVMTFVVAREMRDHNGEASGFGVWYRALVPPFDNLRDARAIFEILPV